MPIFICGDLFLLRCEAVDVLIHQGSACAVWSPSAGCSGWSSPYIKFRNTVEKATAGTYNKNRGANSPHDCGIQMSLAGFTPEAGLLFTLIPIEV